MNFESLVFVFPKLSYTAVCWHVFPLLCHALYVHISARCPPEKGFVIWQRYLRLEVGVRVGKAIGVFESVAA